MNSLRVWIVTAVIVLSLAAATVALAVVLPTGGEPVETHRACYTESFGAGTVPTSKEIPCP